jgi:hypothetical protein
MYAFPRRHHRPDAPFPGCRRSPRSGSTTSTPTCWNVAAARRSAAARVGWRPRPSQRARDAAQRLARRDALGVPGPQRRRGGRPAGRPHPRAEGLVAPGAGRVPDHVRDDRLYALWLPITLAALQAQRQHQAEDRTAVGGGYRDQGYVFTWPDGRPLHPETSPTGSSNTPGPPGSPGSACMTCATATPRRPSRPGSRPR